MHIETYTQEIRVRTPNQKCIQVVLQIQGIIAEWGKSVATILTLSGVMATLLFFWNLDTITCTYERMFPPPIPPIGHAMQIYRFTQHILSFAALSFLTWCIHTLLFAFFVVPKKEALQKELESLLTTNPGFLNAIRQVDLSLYEQTVAFLPAESEHFAT
ncbi:MAG: hypothetical protein A3C02_03140 [Candidatus Andersenbacteria bacterium RIFCSPHIGHO2_02_FULL_45_11]|uniref:Uncharacterized protein n=1 Tax=Candidatus Andersenbacteria bacterium RIFCSPHIGHO2_12_FULL_45_11 TaxID=1797281 RepID=A0A1G1X3J6_9BACT|nr:MAG: hypothetical protein A2805_01915 [Candidatus Andersenbacteria bacterium RIFCSPHIGHO2_01_FULL_46_36]OGY34006.1 MAG: hypothetical protein A3C02_03140 [Candidatus Andersenbacteria bacterium RIFCSPHIGHO2_02_FULL_45_11]OGY34140.1 MAG: hypothetical protein A3D99_00260 [Candidatus Andersenbacteria bacterium RIFCSPHIGHO2_12_FULL_45_11]QBM02257.1 hypothetical protein [uncultured archaeon]